MDKKNLIIKLFKSLRGEKDQMKFSHPVTGNFSKYSQYILF
jgi:hypothetical protein